MTTTPRGLAITSLVLGIVAFLTGWVPYLGLLLGSVAVTLGITALVKRQPKGFAITGLVLGVLAAVTSPLVGIALAIFPADIEAAAPSAPTYSTATEPNADPTRSCLAITDGARTKLAGKIADRLPGAEIKRTGLVQSDASDLWILAIKFHDPGLDRDFTGIWGSMQDLTTDEDPAFVAVDEVAEASAEYLQPSDFDGIGAQFPSAEEALTCLT